MANAPDRELTVLFLDPVMYTPGYDLPLIRALRAAQVRLDVGSCRPIRQGAFEPPQFEFFRFVHRRRDWMLRHRSVRRLVRGLAYPLDLRRLSAHLSRHPHAVVHYNWLVIPRFDLPFMKRLAKRGVAVVLTAHNAKPHEAAGMPRSYVAAYRQADRLITLTEYVKKAIVAEAGVEPEKISVIPHGDLAGYMSAQGDQTPSPVADRFAPRPVVAYLGNIRRYKGVPDLIRAWPAVLEQIPEARLILAGQVFPGCEGEVQEALGELGDSGGSVHTEFAFLSPAKYQTYLSAATALVQPYRAASQSGNTVQAYRAGVPVVCTRVGGLPEMVVEGVTGAVAEPGCEGLADAIVRVLRANADGEMAAECRKLAETRFGWSAIAAATIEVYRDAVRIRARAGA